MPEKPAPAPAPAPTPTPAPAPAPAVQIGKRRIRPGGQNIVEA